MRDFVSYFLVMEVYLTTKQINNQSKYKLFSIPINKGEQQHKQSITL